MNFIKPNQSNNYKNHPRKYGFEFELSGISIEDAVMVVQKIFGGREHYKHSLEAKITDTNLGTFKIELDGNTIKTLISELEQKKEATIDSNIANTEKLRSNLSSLIGSVAELVVPLEIVTPPLEYQHLAKLEELRIALHKKKAKGTKHSVINAFGMHINSEVCSIEPEYIRDIMRSFLLLYPWLIKQMKVDITRRALTFINPFPEAYKKHVLEYSYTPTLDILIDDYLKHNPTRNRALDLLPLLVFLKPSIVGQIDEMSRPLVKPRPAFHYRLPNCEVDTADWSIAREWKYWIEIEKLAENKKKLKAISNEYLNSSNKILPNSKEKWINILVKKYHYEST